MKIRQWEKMAVLWVVAPCCLVEVYQKVWRNIPAHSRLKVRCLDCLNSHSVNGSFSTLFPELQMEYKGRFTCFVL
jgi:hypothetical protein